jgi:osmoprotectant transport system ATP-binding protein
VSTLEFERVSLRFPHNSRPAVEECSFSVASGQLVVILGPSGCGKTTLLKMVNRLLEPTQGQIRLDGQDIRRFPVTALRQRIGYVIQQVGLFPHMTVAKAYISPKINCSVKSLEPTTIGLPKPA